MATKPTTRTIDDQKVRGVVLPDVDTDAFNHIPSTAIGSVAVREDESDVRSRIVDAEVPKGRFLPFDRPGRRIETKAIYTVKAHTPDGRLVQLPLEDQINNQIASPENFVGLQYYVRKGFEVFIDFATGKALFCPTWGCYAEWNDKYHGFCSEAHQAVTKPEAGKEASGFSLGATTSARWSGRA
jgi:hypothetical protein